MAEAFEVVVSKSTEFYIQRLQEGVLETSPQGQEVQISGPKQDVLQICCKICDSQGQMINSRSDWFLLSVSHLAKHDSTLLCVSHLDSDNSGVSQLETDGVDN